MNRLKKFVLFLLAFSFVFSFVGCSDSNSGPDPKDVITEEDGLDYLWPEDRYMPTFVNEPAEHIDFIDLTEFSDEVILLMTSLKAIVNAEQPHDLPLAGVALLQIGQVLFGLGVGLHPFFGPLVSLLLQKAGAEPLDARTVIDEQHQHFRRQAQGIVHRI